MRILIASANGYGNIGDDLATLAVGNFFKHQLKNPTIRLTRPPINEALVAWADVVVVGGGGLFFDALPDNVENYLAYLRVAKRHNRLTMVLGVGTQGITTKTAQNAYREVLNKIDLITVRHQHDADALQAIGVTRTIHVLADPVFSLSKAPHKYPVEASKKRRPILGISLANTRQRPEVMAVLEPALREKWQKLQDKTDANLAELAAKYDLRLILHSEDDRELYQEWSAKYNIPILGAEPKSNKPHIAKNSPKIYHTVDYVLTSRFHGLILAVLAKKPVFALGFGDTKIHWTIQKQLPALQNFYLASEDFITNENNTLASCVQRLKKFHLITGELRKQVKEVSSLARSHESLIAQKLRKTKSRIRLIQSRIMRVVPTADEA